MSRMLLTSALFLAIAAVAVADDAPAKKPKGDVPAARPEKNASGYHYGSGPAGKPSQPTKRLVYKVKNMPVADLAKTIGEFLRAEGKVADRVVIVSERISNTLLVSAPPDDLEALGDVIAVLDARPAMVTIEVLLATVRLPAAPEKPLLEQIESLSGEPIDAVIEALGKQGSLDIVARPAVTTLDNQAAFINLGKREPRITGAATSSRGQTNTVTLENVGLTLGVTARINAEGLVTMEVDVEESRLGPEEEGKLIATSSEGQQIRSPEVRISTLQTTVSATSGQSVILGGLMTQEASETPVWEGTLVMLVPHVHEAE